MRTWSRCLPIGAAALSMVVLAACGSSGSDKTTRGVQHRGGQEPALTTSKDVACIPPAPTTMPKDPDGVVAGLTGAAKAGMGGYPGTVYKSPWVTFKSQARPAVEDRHVQQRGQPERPGRPARAQGGRRGQPRQGLEDRLDDALDAE